MLAALAVLTLVVGNVVALVQTNLKRMLAYSTIANVGFIVLGFVAGTPAGYSAALYYTLVYVLVALGSFGVILLASRKGFEADELDALQGPVPARSAARLRHDGADVLHRRRAAVRRLLGEAAHHPGAVGDGITCGS